MEFDGIMLRRTWLAAACTGGAWLLAGCAATAPPDTPAAPPPAPTLSLAQELAALGFQTTDDGWEFSLHGKLLFGSDSDTLDSETLATAEKLGRQLARLGVTRVRVEGHTDNTGSASYNQQLSLRRAQAVVRAMVGAGLDEAGIRAVGMGMAAPITGNSTPEQRLQNRRVAIVVPAQ